MAARTLALAERGQRLRKIVETISLAMDAAPLGYEETLRAARRRVSLDGVQRNIDSLELSSESWAQARSMGLLYVYAVRGDGPFGYTLLRRPARFDRRMLVDYRRKGIYFVRADVFLREMEVLKRDIAEGRLDDQTHLYSMAQIYNHLKRNAGTTW